MAMSTDQFDHKAFSVKERLFLTYDAYDILRKELHLFSSLPSTTELRKVAKEYLLLFFPFKQSEKQLSKKKKKNLKKKREVLR